MNMNLKDPLVTSKILFIQPSYYPANPSSGPNISLHILAKALVKKGFDVTVYTTDYDLHLEPDISHNVDGVKVFYFKSSGKNYLGQISLKMYRALKKNLLNFDWIYITPLWSPVLWYPMFLVSKTHVPFIISPRGNLYPEVVEKKNYFIKKMCFRLLEPCIAKAAYFHYTTEDEERKANNYWKCRVPSITIPNGIDLEKFDDLPPKGYFRKKFGVGRYLLHLGRLNWKKGLDLSAKVFSRLAREYPDLAWVIAGRDDGYKKILLKILKKLGCEHRVKFVNVLQAQDKLGAFVDAEAFVLASYSENFGMAAIEAMACGTPAVISQNVGISEEVLRHEAAIVVLPEVESLYNGVKIILQNEDKASQLSSQGRDFVRNFYNINNVAEKMSEVLRSSVLNK